MQCKICLKEFEKTNFFSFSNICPNCFAQFDVKFIWLKINKIKALVIYSYNDFFRNLLYLYKGCYDYELKDVFLKRFSLELRIIFLNYIVIPIPSNESDDLKRGFNHVEEIAKSIGFKIEKHIFKNKYFKQSERNKKEREEIKNDLEIIDGEKLKNKKILLIDDVTTTGSTLKCCYELINEYKPKLIKALVLAKKFEK